MQTHDTKRIAIIIESPMKRRLVAAIEQAGVSGYSILPVEGGSGRSGPWYRESQVGRTGGMSQVICAIRPDRLDTLLEAIFSVVERHIGVVTVSDCQVLHTERF